MNILFTRFPLDSRFGGAEVQTLSLMDELQRKGHTVSFLGSCAVLTKELGVQPIDIGSPPVTKWGSISFFWRKFAMRKRLIQEVQKEQPNAICMLSLSEKLLLTKWATEQNIKVFWVEHDKIGRWLRWNPWLPTLRKLSRLVKTVVVSDLSKRMYLDLGWREEDIAVIVNGIDMNRFQKTENRNTPYHLPPTTYHLGCIARLSPEKGVDLLIKAVRDIPNVQLTIVGTGKDEEHIQKLARESPADITVLPSVPDVGAFYHSLDLFVLPSPEHDPCPLAPIEAIACGVPTILTDACGTAEYVSTEALVVTAGSIEALRDAIRKVISGQWTIDKERLQQVVRQKFGFERMIGEYEQLLI